MKRAGALRNVSTATKPYVWAEGGFPKFTIFALLAVRFANILVF